MVTMPVRNIRRTAFGTEVKLELVRRGMTSRDLARSIGIAETTLCDVIAGRNNSRVTKQKIVNGLALKELQEQLDNEEESKVTK